MTDTALQQLTIPIQITCGLLIVLGITSILRGPSIIRQIFGFKIILIALELFFLHSGAIHHQLPQVQVIIVIMLVVESVFMAVALALITNYYEHFPTGKFRQDEGDAE